MGISRTQSTFTSRMIETDALARARLSHYHVSAAVNSSTLESSYPFFIVGMFLNHTVRRLEIWRSSTVYHTDPMAGALGVSVIPIPNIV